jgi:hypothetical protein
MLAVDDQSLESVPHLSAVIMLEQTNTRYSTALAGTVHLLQTDQDYSSLSKLQIWYSNKRQQVQSKVQK